MKRLMIAAIITFAGASATSSAFADQPAAAATASATVAQAGQWVLRYRQTGQPKTRAQMYHELVQAEKDGQTAYLDSTLYACR
jgi:Domain of unknown function (DUF4148)